MSFIGAGSISEMAHVLDERDGRPFYERILSMYPPICQREVMSGKSLLINGLDYDKMTITETAYFLSKEPLFLQRQIIDQDVPGQDKNNKITMNASSERISSLRRFSSEELGMVEHCFCGKPQSPTSDESFLQCDGCSNWFHPFCAKVSKKELALLSTYNQSMRWFCNQCMIIKKNIE